MMAQLQDVSEEQRALRCKQGFGIAVGGVITTFTISILGVAGVVAKGAAHAAEFTLVITVVGIAICLANLPKRVR
jgi:hypothetical protein